jgi:arylsulfatase A-like enzyme
VHRPRSALVALCAIVALVATACTGATAVTPDDTRGQGAARAADSAPAPAGRRGGGPGTPGDRAGDDGKAWQLSPQWALNPELLTGSQRFRRLARKGAPTPGEPTNVVMITTDDMTTTDLRWMPKTRALIGGAGVAFEDSLAPHPLCCPSRAQLLTGQHAHNNGVRTNHPPLGGYRALDSSETLPVWLDRAGYQTAFMGKYLNQYGERRPHHVPAGWDDWLAPMHRVYDYYNFTANTNGRLRRYSGTYQTEMYADRTERLIPEMAGRKEPFFLWQSHLAPHAACPAWASRNEMSCWEPALPSTQYNGWYDDVMPPQLDDPAYNERDVSDKPEQIASLPRLNRYPASLIDRFQERVESLRSVDDAVARTVDALKRAGVLDNTLVIFTSDNGYLMGQHRASGKTLPYEPSLQVPLLMRGPSVPAGVRRPATTGTLDLAPTALAAADAEAGLPVDGRNLLPVAAGRKPGWETVLVQGGPRNADSGWMYRGVRTSRYTYVEYRETGEVELYDRRRDPHQLRNVAGSDAYTAVQAELRDRLLALQDCAGASCRQRFGPAPEPRG